MSNLLRWEARLSNSKYTATVPFHHDHILRYTPSWMLQLGQVWITSMQPSIQNGINMQIQKLQEKQRKKLRRKHFSYVLWGTSLKETESSSISDAWETFGTAKILLVFNKKHFYEKKGFPVIIGISV